MTWYEMGAHWTASKTKAVFTWLPLLLTETAETATYNLLQKIHVKISERAAKADVNTDSFVIQQWSNPMKGGLSTAVEMKYWPVDCVEMWHHWTQTSVCNYTFFTSFDSKCSPIDHSHTWFEFSVLVMQLNPCHQMISVHLKWTPELPVRNALLS